MFIVIRFKPNINIFSDKPSKIVEMENSKFADIKNDPETCLQKVFNFSHFWDFQEIRTKNSLKT